MKKFFCAKRKANAAFIAIAIFALVIPNVVIHWVQEGFIEVQEIPAGGQITGPVGHCTACAKTVGTQEICTTTPVFSRDACADMRKKGFSCSC